MTAAQVFTLSDAQGLRLQVLDVGATWFSLQVPVAGEAAPREVLLGAATPEAHLANTAYLGATVGRVANRIAGAKIERDGQAWTLAAQPGSRHQLHGGPDGYERRHWRVDQANAQHLSLRLHSPDGDQGFPGALDIEVQLSLPGHGVVDQRITAICTAPTPVCITNHAYFNLDGRPGDVRLHALQLRAAHYTPVDDELIPLGELAPVAASPEGHLDFRQLRPIGLAGGVIDHGLLFSARPGSASEAPPAERAAELADVRLVAADGRLQMTLDTSMPALQVYTGQHLAGQPGRQGPLAAFGGVALEPQWLPDSVHHPEWPQPPLWLLPGQRWQHQLRYRFGPGPAAWPA